jgi:hypothetical protein
VTWSVTADGFPAPTFQWRKDGANISGATEASYTRGPLQASDAGTYTVVVTNSVTSITSSAAVLTVGPAPAAPDFVGVLAEWDFSGNAGAASSPADGFATGLTVTPATFGAGLTAINYAGGNGFSGVNQTAADLAGALAGNDYIGFTLTPAAGRSLTLSALKVRPLSQNRQRTFTVFTSAGGFGAGQQVASFTHDGGVNAAQLNVPLSGIPARTTPLEVRIYVHGHTNQYEAAGFGNANGADLIVEGGLANTAPATFADWIAALPNPPPADQRAPGDDPDRDGLPNLLEYALELDPVATSVTNFQLQASGSTLSLTYRRARAGLTYVVETSATLAPGSWTTVDVAQGSGAVGANVTASVPLTPEQPRRFLRLRVE